MHSAQQQRMRSHLLRKIQVITPAQPAPIMVQIVRRNPEFLDMNSEKLILLYLLIKNKPNEEDWNIIR